MGDYYANYEDILNLPDKTRQDIANWINVNNMIEEYGERWVMIDGPNSKKTEIRAKLISRLKVDYKHTVRVRQF